MFNQTENIDKRYFPWEDVEPCITEKAIELETKCLQCGHPKKEVFFKSPDWTWEDLCGCKGILTICEHCKIQFDFRCTGMN